jgi:hypothetical protein
MSGSKVRWLVLGMALTMIPMQPGNARTTGELQKRLLPAPHKIEVKGGDRRLSEGALAAVASFDQGKIPFDLVKVLTEPVGAAAPRPVQRIALKLPAAQDPVWALALVPNRATIDAKTIRGWQKAARAQGAEGYVLETFPEQGVIALVVGGGPRGLLYGVQTLAQLLGLSRDMLPHVRIEDAPDFAVREAHIHGFDKGYGAGDFKSVASFKEQLPSFFRTLSRARYNLFRFSMDAGWITDGDRWIKDDIDRVMQGAIQEAHRQGVDVVVEVRFEGQRAGSTEIDFYPLNPLTEWDTYEKALRRALRWGPDVVDLSFNDLRPVTYPDVLEKYGVDGRFSGKLMAKLLHKAKAIIAQEKPDTALYHLPRFYGGVHWKQHPRALPELAANAPRDVTVYTTSGLLHPDVAALRSKYGTRFILWVNYTSNHAKELRVILDGSGELDLTGVAEKLPSSERRVLINFGYPVLPQRTVILATGEALWNGKAYDKDGAFAKAARRVWGEGADILFLRYARLLDWDTIIGSLGMKAAALVEPPPAAADEAVANLGKEATSPDKEAAKWERYRSRAEGAADVAKALEKAVSDPELKRVADILYWNAQKVQIDSQIGVLLASGLARDKRVDVAAVEKLLKEHERILAGEYPVEPNDPKSAEVSTRGIRRIRAALEKLSALGGRDKE